MISWSLYKRGLRRSSNTWLVFTAVLTMYIVIIVLMFEPGLRDALDEFVKTMPELMAMFGMTYIADELIYYLSSYLYGFLMLVFPMVYSILISNRLIARLVDSGSMVYLLAAPVSRVTVAFTQMKVLATGLIAMVLYSTVLGIIVSHLAFPGLLDIKGYWLINLGVLALQLLIGGFCFLASCIFNDSRRAVSVGAGVPSFMFILTMLSNAGERYAGVKFLSVFTLYQPDGIIQGERMALWNILILFVLAVFMFYLAILIFRKKDLHI